MSRPRGVWFKGKYLTESRASVFFFSIFPLVGEMAPVPVLGSVLSCRPWADLCLCCMAVKQGQSQLIADLSERSHQHQVCLLSAEMLGIPLLAISVPSRAGGIVGRLELDFLQESNPVSCRVLHRVL